MLADYDECHKSPSNAVIEEPISRVKTIVKKSKQKTVKYENGNANNYEK